MNYKYLNVIGMMSGTSLDGIDISLVKTNGIDLIRLNKNFYHQYDNEVRDYLLNTIKKNVDLNLENQTIIADLITKEHIKALENFDFIDNCDLIGFHGQTIYHNPSIKTSIQLGNPITLAKTVKKNVIFDFRSKDIQHGGQGAPLAPIYHKHIIETTSLKTPSCIINIGGVTNLTFWDGITLIGFDTGPGNVLMDDYARKISNNYFDIDGETASRGKPDKEMVKNYLQNDFFHAYPPKSFDKHDFIDFYQKLLETKLSKYDIMATLAELTVSSIILAFQFLPQTVKNVLIAGGGCRNKYIMRNLKKRLNVDFKYENDLQICLNYLESELIAYLSARSLYNLPFTFPSTTGVSKELSGGKLYKYL